MKYYWIKQSSQIQQISQADQYLLCKRYPNRCLKFVATSRTEVIIRRMWYNQDKDTVDHGVAWINTSVLSRILHDVEGPYVVASKN